MPLTKLDEKLRALLNSVSRENASDTPDYILASYMLTCLGAFETAVVMRDTWHGFKPRNTFGGDGPLAV